MLSKGNNLNRKGFGQARHHDEEVETFYIKGPMGRGLELDDSGVHVAFAAGTGALVFLDLVTHLLLRNTQPKEKRSNDFSALRDGFVFHFYCAFQNEDQAIGLELCNALEKINHKLQIENFRVVVRLSEGNKYRKKPQRWDEDYIEKELMPYAGKIKKIWVCGPPMLNQSFDIALDNLKHKLKLQDKMIDIL